MKFRHYAYSAEMCSKVFLLLVVYQLTVAYAHPTGNETKEIRIFVHGSSKINISESTSRVIYVTANGTRTNNSKHIVERKILHHICWIMYLASQELSTIMDWWEGIPITKNIQYFPILHAIRDNMIVMQIYDVEGLAAFYPKHKFLQVPLGLASFLDELEQSSDIILKFNSFLTYDSPWIGDNYMMDLVNYYHTNTYFSSRDTDHLSSHIHGITSAWHKIFTKSRLFDLENIYKLEVTDYQILGLKFQACWTANKRKVLFQIPLLDDGNYTEECIDAFGSDDLLGYHNNSRLGYEAIRIPYKNSGFSMAAILPNESQSFIDIFSNFTPREYLELLEGITRERKYINYSIPTLNISMVLMNENGTWINPNETATKTCESRQLDEYEYKPWKKSEGFLKPIPFNVQKPFGIIIFHDKTKFVLWQAWIRNTNDDWWHRPYRFLKHKNDMGQNFDDRFLF